MQTFFLTSFVKKSEFLTITEKADHSGSSELSILPQRKIQLWNIETFKYSEKILIVRKAITSPILDSSNCDPQTAILHNQS